MRNLRKKTGFFLRKKNFRQLQSYKQNNAEFLRKLRKISYAKKPAANSKFLRNYTKF